MTHVMDNEQVSFHTIWEAVDEAMVLSDKDGIVIDINPAYISLYGYSREELIGKKFSIIFPQEMQVYAEENYQKYFKEGKRSSPVEAQVQDKDGRVHVVFSRYSFITYRNEKVMLSLIQDVTLQKRAESNLRFLSDAGTILSSSLDYKKTLHAIARIAVPGIADWCGIDILDKNGILQQVAVTHVDPKKVKWAKELRKHTPINMDAKTGLPNVLRTGKAEIYPIITDDMLVAVARDKRELALTRSLKLRSVIITPLFSSGKAIGGITFITSETQRTYNEGDLTMAEELSSRASLAIENAGLYTRAQEELVERRKAEIASKKSTDQLFFMAESIPVKIFTTRPNGEANYFNKQWEDYTGLSLEQIRNWGWVQFIHPDEVKANIQAWKDALSSGEPFQYEHRFRRADGEYRWHLSRMKAMRDNKGEIMLWIGTSTDIDDQKKQEEQKDEFIGIVSHELKTPVTSLKAYAQVLQRQFEKIGNKNAAQAIKKMDLQLDKLTALIVDLLDVTKIEGGKLQFYNEQFSLDELLKETINEMQLTTHKHMIILRGNVIKPIIADKERIGQIIINLLSNAIKYSPDSKNIDVRVQNTPHEVIVGISDYGMGISKENQVHLFERFYRVTTPNSILYPGLGLGLYICAEIMKRQQGRLWVESSVGKGSTFFFSLPLKALHKS